MFLVCISKLINFIIDSKYNLHDTNCFKFVKTCLWQVHGKFLLKTSIYAEGEYALVTFRVQGSIYLHSIKLV